MCVDVPVYFSNSIWSIIVWVIAIVIIGVNIFFIIDVVVSKLNLHIMGFSCCEGRPTNCQFNSWQLNFWL